MPLNDHHYAEKHGYTIEFYQLSISLFDGALFSIYSLQDCQPGALGRICLSLGRDCEIVLAITATSQVMRASYPPVVRSRRERKKKNRSS